MDAISYSQLEHLAEHQLAEVAHIHCVIPSAWVADHCVTPAEKWLLQHGATEIKTEVFSANRKMLSLNQKFGYQTVMQVMSKPLRAHANKPQ